MTQLKADFVRDWLGILADILRDHWGYDISNISEDELPYVYFNAEQRRPDPRPRRIVTADTFSCPPDLQAGWERLRSLVESGRDITPHLSTFVDELRKRDSMLNDWGVHHFHLGTTLKGAFVQRTGPLLFALVTKQTFYAIGIFVHGSWADASVVATIHCNWPEVIEPFRVKNCEEINQITEAQRKILRSKNANSMVTVPDGTVYMPIGGGTVAAGYNLASVIRIDKQKELLVNLERCLQERLPEISDRLADLGYSGNETTLEAKLEIMQGEYLAIFPKYNVAVTLMTQA